MCPPWSECSSTASPGSVRKEPGRGRRGGVRDTDRMLLASYAQVPQEGEGGVGGEKAGEAVAMDVSDDEDDDSSDRLRGASVAASVVRKKEEAAVTSRARCESTDDQLLLGWLWCSWAGREGSRTPS